MLWDCFWGHFGTETKFVVASSFADNRNKFLAVHVHLLNLADLEFYERRYYSWQNSRQVTSLTRRTTDELSSAWNSDLFTHIFTRKPGGVADMTASFSSLRRKPITRAFRTGFPCTNSHSSTRLGWTTVILNSSETSKPLSNLICTVAGRRCI